MPQPDSAELLALLTLRFTPQLGPRRIEHLRRHFGSAQAVLAANLGQWREVGGLDAKSLAALGQPEAAAKAQRELERCKLAGVQLLGRGLNGYPEALESLGDPPAVLWVRGELPQLPAVPRAIGIVGTRGASQHALTLTRQLAADLARTQVIVISGLARGIDTAAHSAAIDAGGQSIAVLGSAVDRVYPAENSALARKLTLVSEYPLGTGPAQHHFPTRNRIIAALSAGIVVVEGERKSGSMISATHALECGRTVFAVPGRAGDPLASGPHHLLREGAVLTESAQDIVDELGWGAVAVVPTLDLPEPQHQVFTALAQPTTLEDLQALTGLGIAELQTALVMLQLMGLAEETGGRWVKR